jgi:hypothetical protein
MKTAGAFGGPTSQGLIPGRFLMGRWWRNRKSIQKNALKSNQSPFEKLPVILDLPRLDPPHRYMEVLQIPNVFFKNPANLLQ